MVNTLYIEGRYVANQTYLDTVQNTKSQELESKFKIKYIGNLENATSGTVTIENLSKYNFLCIAPWGNALSAPAPAWTDNVRFSGVATDGNVAAIYQVGFSKTGDDLTFTYNKAYAISNGKIGDEYAMRFAALYGIEE